MKQIIDEETVVPGGDTDCNSDTNERHELCISVKSRRREEGKWETSFYAKQNSSHQPRDIDVNVTRKFIKCRGNYSVEIAGVVKDIHQEGTVAEHFQERIWNGLTFKKSSQSAVITNNGRSIRMKKNLRNGSGITNRPLKDDEIFTVQFDKKEGWIGGRGCRGPSFGVTELTHDKHDIMDDILEYKSGTWIFFMTHLCKDGQILNEDYLLVPLIVMKAGDTIGVMRSRVGNLHFFINGVDQGIAACNIPETVYGILNVCHTHPVATIVDAKMPSGSETLLSKVKKISD